MKSKIIYKLNQIQAHNPGAGTGVIYALGNNNRIIQISGTRDEVKNFMNDHLRFSNTKDPQKYFLCYSNGLIEKRWWDGKKSTLIAKKYMHDFID